MLLIKLAKILLTFSLPILFASKLQQRRSLISFSLKGDCSEMKPSRPFTTTVFLLQRIFAFPLKRV
jgi:hypothetical protein